MEQFCLFTLLLLVLARRIKWVTLVQGILYLKQGHRAEDVHYL
jgi:hypothetical protein